MTPLNWHTWIEHGDQYLRSGKGKPGRKVKFSGTVRYNLLSMAYESYAMAILDWHHSLPDNHTYSDLMRGLERVISIDPDLKKRILSLENIQSICSLERFHIRPPSEDQLDTLVEAVEELSQIAHQECAQPV